MKIFGLIRFTQQQPYKELTWTLGAIVLYVLAFELAYPLMGLPIVPLAALPAMLAGWLLGLQAGLLTGVLMNFLNLVLFSSVSTTPVLPILLAMPNALAVIVSGTLTGWLRQLLDRVKQQSQQLVQERAILEAEVVKRRKVEKALRRVQSQLEQRVEERTTALAEANATLRQTEINLTTILDNGSQAFALVDRDYQVRAVNRVFRQFIQDLADTQIENGHSILDYIPVAQQPKFKKDFEATLKGRPRIFEESITGINQIEYWFEWTYTPVVNQRGRVTQVCIAGIEITDRRQAEERLWQVAQRFQSLIENSADVVAIFDRTGVFRYLSPSADRVLGYRPEDVIGKSVLDLIHPDDVNNSRAAFALVSQPIEKEVLPILARIQHQNGTWRTVEGLSKNLLDNPAVNGIVITVRDVTERVEADKSLRAYTIQLEQSNSELQNFAFIASHDLQEPLRKVQAFGDRLQRKYSAVLDERGHDYIGRMQDAAARMQTLIQDLLMFSRVTTKAQPFVQVDLTELAHRVVAELEPLIQQVGGRVAVGELPTIEADPLQMSQLLHNLIHNGLKFHEAGQPPVVEIKGKTLKKETGYLVRSSSTDVLGQIIVKDNGIGFEEKYLDRIFQVFQRLHGREKYGGTGIGLAICRKIAERHGGSIGARSAPGKGATFLVTLPVRQSVEHKNLLGQPQAPAVAAVPAEAGQEQL